MQYLTVIEEKRRVLLVEKYMYKNIKCMRTGEDLSRLLHVNFWACWQIIWRRDCVLYFGRPSVCPHGTISDITRQILVKINIRNY